MCCLVTRVCTLFTTTTIQRYTFFLTYSRLTMMLYHASDSLYKQDTELILLSAPSTLVYKANYNMTVSTALNHVPKHMPAQRNNRVRGRIKTYVTLEFLLGIAVIPWSTCTPIITTLLHVAFSVHVDDAHYVSISPNYTTENISKNFRRVCCTCITVDSRDDDVMRLVPLARHVEACCIYECIYDYETHIICLKLVTRLHYRVCSH